MYFKSCSAIALSLSLAALGCNDAKTTSSATSSPADREMADALEKTKIAAHASAVAFETRRAEYSVAMHQQLAALDLKIADMKFRATVAQGESKQKLNERLAAAQVKRDAAAVRLEEVKTASTDRWEKVQEGVGNALADLKKAFE
ncbi:MAG: hypothetical protein C0483_19830 [Pirellula sp.]|nr:hypothetical protein [Pirellula sp.]